MPKFQVLRRVDAYVDYVAEVEADNPTEAAELASDDESAYEWQSQGEVEFDARLFVALDKDGREIDGTQQGDF
jgi:exonuclease VII large subunit